jgi:hypothetical protein
LRKAEEAGLENGKPRHGNSSCIAGRCLREPNAATETNKTMEIKASVNCLQND